MRGLLKLLLTDGSSRAYGFEYGRIHDLTLATSPGTKILVENVTVERGFLVLAPNNTRVLGGGKPGSSATPEPAADALVAVRPRAGSASQTSHAQNTPRAALAMTGVGGAHLAAGGADASATSASGSGRTSQQRIVLTLEPPSREHPAAAPVPIAASRRPAPSEVDCSFIEATASDEDEPFE